jgi:hypothetical protein
MQLYFNSDGWVSKIASAALSTRKSFSRHELFDRCMYEGARDLRFAGLRECFVTPDDNLLLSSSMIVI